MFRTAQYFIVFLLFTVFNLLFTIPAHAQERDLHNYTQRVMIEVTSSLTCMLSGIDPINPTQQCLGVNNGKVGPVDTSGGAIGGMGNLIAMTFNIPAHTGDYFSYLASNFGVAKPTYAQGIGFKSLTPLADIWVAFRNIAYLLFILIFVVIGFAIMLRVRIDPRTVMTIENQIPKIIIGIILVTFSLAIAGFLIDLMWVFSYLVIEVFASIDPGVKSIVTSFQGQNALEVANNIRVTNEPSGWIGIVKNSSGAVGHIVSNMSQGLGGTILGDFLVGIFTFLLITFGRAAPILSAASALPFLGKAVISLVAGTVAAVGFGGAILGVVGGLIAFVVIAIAVLWALFRLWFALIKAYVFILINTVFAPFWIIAGLVPGSKLSFTGWLRDMAGNLVAFPATLVMFLLAQVFITKFGTTQTGGQFVPPLIGNPGEPNAIGALIGLGMILLTPAVVDMMRKALQAPDIDISAIWKAVGVGTGVGGIPTSVGRIGMEFTYATHLPFIGGALDRLGQLGRGKKPAV